MQSLGIINGIINAKIQTAYFPEFAYSNTYGIQAVNETIYNFMKMAYYIPGGQFILSYRVATASFRATASDQ